MNLNTFLFWIGLCLPKFPPTRIMGVLSRPLTRHQVWLLISFGGIGLLSMEDCAPSTFLGNWALVVPYLCSKFRIFNKSILEEYVSQDEGGPHLLQSCLRVAWNSFPPVVKEMQFFLKTMVVIGILSLQASLMGTHHDSSLRSILEDDSISLAFKVRIHSCLGKGAGLWLVVKPFIRLFCIAHSTFTSMLCFHLVLLQLLASSPLMCECGHTSDAFGTHLNHCPFTGQGIATHDVIRDVMYAFTRMSGHVVWRERWYTFMSRV
jgi:hypothetical protein